MKTTQLSSKGQPQKPFPETKLEDVAGCLHYKGKPKTIEEMNEAINQGFQESWNDSCRY
jgi:hypothetical protein